MSQPAVGGKGVCNEDGQEDQEFKKKKLTDYFAVKPSKLQLQQLPSLPKRGRGRPPKPLSLDSTSPTKKLKENNELTEKYGRTLTRVIQHWQQLGMMLLIILSELANF